MKEDNPNVTNATNANSGVVGNPSCFIANTRHTQALAASVEQQQQQQQGAATNATPMAFPVLNMGMPKAGSTDLVSIFHYFKIRASHDQRAAIDQKKPPIGSCNERNNKVHMQMDSNWPNRPPKGCLFPQIQFLDEIHREYPHATLVLNFRPVQDWIHSVRSWDRNLASRWGLCFLPGLAHRYHDSNNESSSALTDQELASWHCSHVQYIREFVRHYPSHKLIELDLYDNEGSSELMSKLFGAERRCWAQQNVNKKKAAKQANNATAPAI
jgi:hypothetical protein